MITDTSNNNMMSSKLRGHSTLPKNNSSDIAGPHYVPSTMSKPTLSSSRPGGLCAIGKKKSQGPNQPGSSTILGGGTSILGGNNVGG